MVKAKSRRKCPVCEKTSNIEGMVEYERVPKRMFHPECVEKERERFRALDKENEAKDLFWNTFVDMIGFKLDDITSRGYSMGENLRNGNPVFKGKKVEKRYRDGFGWDIMTETILSRRETIEYVMENKEFNNMDTLCAYMFRIIMNYIPMVNKKVLKQRKAEAIAQAKKADSSEDERFEATLESIKKETTERKRKRKRKKEETIDISAFLD